MDMQMVTSSLRLREYYYMALRHKKYMGGAIVLSLTVALGLALFLPKVYQAETVLLVLEEKILNPLISGLAISPRVSDRMRTLREELLSWERLTRLVDELDLDQGVKTPLGFEQLIMNLREKIKIKMRGYDIITVQFEGPDPKKAQTIVQTLAGIIVEGNITRQNLQAGSAIGFIEGQLGIYRDKLEGSERTLREFKEVYNSTLPIATRMNEQLVALKLELNRLLIDNTEEHPRVIQTKKLIEQLGGQRTQLMQQAQEEGAAIDPSEYANLVSSVPRQQQELARLNRDYSVNAKIYETFLQKLETAKISQMLEDSDKGTKFSVLEPARLPLKPVKPNKPIILLAGLITGLGLGTLLIYLVEMSNNSLRNVDEARFLLDLPILGAITTIRPKELLAEARIRKAAASV